MLIRFLSAILILVLASESVLIGQVSPDDPACYEQEMLRRQPKPSPHGTAMLVSGLGLIAVSWAIVLTNGRQDVYPYETKWGNAFGALGIGIVGGHFFNKGRRERSRYRRYKIRMRTNVAGCDWPFREDRWRPVDLERLRKDYERMENQRREALGR